MRVEEYDGSPLEWDTFVRSQQEFTHFHLYGWRDVMRRALRHDTPYLVARTTHNRIAGVLPLVRVKSRLFGHYLTSLPFVNYGGPLGSDEAVLALSDYAVKIAQADQVDIVELRSRNELPLALKASHRKITVVLEIPEGGADELWKQIPAKVRSQVRRPQKEGMTTRFGADQLDGFYRVFTKNMRDLGTPTQSKKLFETLLEVFPDDVIVGCVYHKDAPVAAGIAIGWDREVEITWASSLREFNKLAPNMLLYWDFMSEAAARGAKLFNFGRCSPDTGTHKFKRQWGATDESLWWYEVRRTGAVAPAEGDSAFQMGPHLWKKLPLSVANLLGPSLVRLIP